MNAIADRLRRLRHSELVSLGRSSSFLFAMRIVGAATVYFTQVLLARWAGPAELGIYVFAFSWCIVISNVAVMGFPTVAVRVIGAGLASDNRTLARGFVRRSRQLVVGYAIVLAALATLVVLWWSPKIEEDKIVPLLIAFACIPLFSLMRVQGGIAHAFSWFGIRDLTNQVLRPLLLLSAIWVVWSSEYPLSAALVVALHFAIILLLDAGQAFFLARGLKKELSHVAPSYETAAWLRSALPLLFISLFTLYFPELNIILVGTFLPDADVAVYNACLRTAFLIAFGLIAVDSVILPRISYLYEKGDTQHLQCLISRSTLLKVFGALLAFAVLALAGKQILGLFGPDFVHGYPVLLLLGLAQLIRAIGGIAAELLAVTGQQNRCLPVFGSALVATLVLNSLLVPAFGLIGAAASIFIVIALSTIWLNALVFHHLSISPSIFAVKFTRLDPSCQKSGH